MLSTQTIFPWKQAFTFAVDFDHGGPGGDQVDGGRRRVRAVHVPDQLGQSELPLGVRILL
jgi:hypothetical protein